MTALGMVEATGFLAVFEVAEAMTKAARVEIRGMISLGSGMVAVAVEGELAQVNEGIRIAEEIFRAEGAQAVSCVVLAEPIPFVRTLFHNLGQVG